MPNAKKKNRRLLITVVILLLIAIAIVLIQTPDTNKEKMIAKYSNQHSKFMQDDTGLRIHYRDQGNKNDTPIIFLHGSPSSLHTFEPLFEVFDQNYRLISYDHPGHGLTGPNPEHDYTYQGFAKALDLVVSELNLEQFILVGHSLGGWISWRYAAEHPESVTSLVLISASGMPDLLADQNRDISFALRVSQSAAGRKLPEYIMPRSMVANSSYKAMYDDELVTDEVIDLFWELMRYPGNRQAFTIRNAQDRDEHLADTAKSIQAPTLLIWGEQDTFVPPSSTKAFSDRIGNTETVLLPNVGHFSMFEAPKKTAQAIEAFLEKHKQP